MSFTPNGDSVLQNLHNAMEYNAEGDPVVRVTLGSENITITGDVNVGTTVNVESSPENPVHVHLTEIGTTTLAGTVPVSGTVAATQSGIWDVEIKNEDGNPISVIGTIAATQSGVWDVEIKNEDGNPISIIGEVTTPTAITQEDSNYEMNVARGLVPGHIAVTRSGFNPDCASGVLESIWVEGGIYPFTAWTIAQPLYVISTSASDNGQQILIEGLDANYNLISEIITTTGIIATATLTNFIRIHTATIISPDMTNIGSITFRLGGRTGTVVAHIGSGLAVTKLSQYTVPAGYTAYIQYGDATAFRSGSGNIGSRLQLMVRPFGRTFIAEFMAEVVNGYYRNDFTVPKSIAEKSDVDIRLLADGNNTQVTCNWQIILIPN